MATSNKHSRNLYYIVKKKRT